MIDRLALRPIHLGVVAVCIVAIAVAISIGTAGTPPIVPTTKPSPSAFVSLDSAPNGTFAVQVGPPGAANVVAKPQFGLTYSAQSVQLGQATQTVRLVQDGGTAAQLDAVTLDGKPPVAVSGLSDTLALGKLQDDDDDVVNALGRAVTLTFANAGTNLLIDARVQGLISRIPFEYPASNTYHPVTGSSEFYSYRLSSAPTKVDTHATPFVSEYVEPGTGHPAGTTYAWVANDAKNLLVKLDFTSDNTMDGSEDYATVHIKTPTGVKDFTISAADTRWGKVEFTYTDKVAYQHKVYSFKIPLSEVHAPSGAVDLGFATYGTASTPAGRSDPAVACDPWSNTYLLVYKKQVSAYTDDMVCGDIMKEDGTPKGPEFAISDVTRLSGWTGGLDIAYDSIKRRYLVVWSEEPVGLEPWEVWGRIVNPDGTFAGPAFRISTKDGDKRQVRVAFDPENGRFYVVWTDASDNICGQLLSSDGSRYGGSMSSNTTITAAFGTQNEPDVAFDSTSQRYLVVWSHSVDTTSGIRGQFVDKDGALSGTELDLNSTTGWQAESSIAFDDRSGRYLLLSTRGKSPSPRTIDALALDSSGVPIAPASLVASETTYAMHADVAVGGGEFWMAWCDWNGVASRVNYRGLSDVAMPGPYWNWLWMSYPWGAFERAGAVYNPRGGFRWIAQSNPGIPSVAMSVQAQPGPDTFAPITTANATNTANSHGWYKSTGAISLAVDEEHPGATQYSWTSGAGPWTPGTDAGAASEGVHTLYYYSADSNGNTETVQAKAFKVDATKPKTYAPKSATVSRHKKARLYWKVTDPYATGKAYVKLVIKKSGKAKQTISLGLVSIGSTKYRTYTATLPRGSYRVYVYATDQAGNTQGNIASNRLTIR